MHPRKKDILTITLPAVFYLLLPTPLNWLLPILHIIVCLSIIFSGNGED
jgi:hypothetical protein